MQTLALEYLEIAMVDIEHRCYSIETKAIEVILIYQPLQIAQQKTQHLPISIIK